MPVPSVRTIRVFMLGEPAGLLEQLSDQKGYRFSYHENYSGPDISLTMSKGQRVYTFESFPPFFDGLLPEGAMLEGLLRQEKIDADDYFSQLVSVGKDMVGAVTVEEGS